MKPIEFVKLTNISLKATSVIALSFVCSHIAFADMGMLNDIRQRLAAYTLDTPHWYVGGNMGVSHVRDEKTPRSTNSVDQNGPGWSVVGGVQINSVFGGELGHTQYHYSRESTNTTVVAKTEHYSTHLAATGRYPLMKNWSALGKLGIAHSYAQKIFATGTAASTSAVSLYWGLGFDYSLTQRIDFIAQYASTRGNKGTGSTDLWSIGLTAALT